MENKTNFSKEYYAEKLAKYFDIDLNNKYLTISSLRGAYATKVKYIFQTSNQIISFKEHPNNKISSNLFNNSQFKRGSSNTYSYVQDALEMFGVKKYEKYEEDKLFKSG